MYKQLLYCILGGSLGRYVQRKLSAEDLWNGQFSRIRDALRTGTGICERWVQVCETLTTQFWKRYGPNPWRGEVFVPLDLKNLLTRLEEVRCWCNIHTVEFPKTSYLYSLSTHVEASCFTRYVCVLLSG